MPGLWSHRRVYSGGSYLLLNSIYVRPLRTSGRDGCYLRAISFLQPFDTRNSIRWVLGAPKSAALVPPRENLGGSYPMLNSIDVRYVTSVRPPNWDLVDPCAKVRLLAAI